jgi:FixJ family two-component response regulator
MKWRAKLKRKLDIVHAHLASLTPRERQVLELIIRGKTNKRAAHALGCTERTIKAHRQMVMEKMQVESLVQRVSVAGSIIEPLQKAAAERL